MTTNAKEKFKFIEQESKFSEDEAEVVIEGPTFQDMQTQDCRTFAIKAARARNFPAYAIASLVPVIYPVDDGGNTVSPVGTDAASKIKAWRTVYRIIARQ